MATKSNPRTAYGREKQLAHEAEHNVRKYGKDGKRKSNTLPPQHLKGQRLLPSRGPDWLHT